MKVEAELPSYTGDEREIAAVKKGNFKDRRSRWMNERRNHKTWYSNNKINYS